MDIINNLTGKSLRSDGVSPGVKARETVSGSDTTQTPAVARGVVGESLTLTDAARSIGAARDNAGQIPFDENKVAALKAAIEDGSYAIDDRRVAGKIVNLEIQLS